MRRMYNTVNLILPPYDKADEVILNDSVGVHGEADSGMQLPKQRP